MPGNLTPPILSEAVVAGQDSVGSVQPTESPRPPQDLLLEHQDAEPDSTPDPSLLDELKSLRAWQREASLARQDLIETHERRERELRARLDQAQVIIDAGSWELEHLQRLQAQHRQSMLLQQEQHQRELGELQQALATARAQMERGEVDLHDQRQRCARLEQECERSECRLNDLERQIQVSSEQLESRVAEITAVRQRCDQLEQQREESARDSATRVQDLEQQCHAAEERLASRDAALAAMQERCQALEQQLHTAAELRDSRDAELTAARQRCQILEQQLRESEEARGSRPHGPDPDGPSPGPAADMDSGIPGHERELQRLQDELIALQNLLEDLPEIYEHKFRQRLQPVLEQRDWLLHENSWLRAELPAALPGPERRALPQAVRLGGLLERVQALLLFRGRGGEAPAGDRHP